MNLSSFLSPILFLKCYMHKDESGKVLYKVYYLKKKSRAQNSPSPFSISLKWWFSSGGNFSPQATPEGRWSRLAVCGATGIQQVETRDAALIPTMHRTASHSRESLSFK